MPCDTMHLMKDLFWKVFHMHGKLICNLYALLCWQKFILVGSGCYMNIFNVGDIASYRDVLDPIYHSKQSFKLRSSNKMQFHHGKERERHPPIQEP
jgi:hypothetical protein